MPAFLAYLSTILWIDRGVRLASSLFSFALSCEMNRNGDISGLLFRYFFRASLALSETNTILLFPPFPVTENSLLFRFIVSISSFDISETLRPVENRSSRIAESLRETRFSPFFGASRSLTSSSASKNSTCLSGILASSIFSAASVFMSRFARYFRNERNAIR